MATDVFDRLAKMRENLSSTIDNLRQRTKTPDEIPEIGAKSEAAPEEDLLAGLAGDEELPGETTAQGAEPDELRTSAPPSALGGEDALETPEEIPELAGEPTETGEEGLEEVSEPVEAPAKRIWKPIDSPDAKNLRFQSDKEGVILDIRMLSVDPKVWLARLQRGGKLLDWGTVLIPKDIRDPMAYIKAISDAMLDVKSMRYEQEWQKKYAEAQGIDLTPTPVPEAEPETPEEAPPEGEEEPPEEGTPPEEGGEGEGGEDILAGLGL